MRDDLAIFSAQLCRVPYHKKCTPFPAAGQNARYGKVEFHHAGSSDSALGSNTRWYVPPSGILTEKAYTNPCEARYFNCWLYLAKASATLVNPSSGLSVY